MNENQAQQAPARPVECFCLGVGPELFRLFKKFGPEAAREHFRNARIEFLKGIRAIIDQRIEELSQRSQCKGTRVAVE